MFIKTIVLNIVCKTPCQLTVFDSFGNIIQKVAIKSTSSKIFICTKGCFIKLMAQNNGITFFKTLCLNSCLWQSVMVNFAFSTRILQRAIITIIITEKNYNLPISNALLRFKQNRKKF